MRYIALPDVFGATSEFASLVASLPQSFDILCPYQGHPPTFCSEQEAYDTFTELTGFEGYVDAVRQALETSVSPVSLLGFSMGASVAWRLSAELPVNRLNGSLGFYGNQIRHHTDLLPNSPYTLVLPESEPHFSIRELCNRITDKRGVRLVPSPYLHGYMNRLSDHFDEHGYASTLRQLSVLNCGESLSSVGLTFSAW